MLSWSCCCSSEQTPKSNFRNDLELFSRSEQYPGNSDCSEVNVTWRRDFRTTTWGAWISRQHLYLLCPSTWNKRTSAWFPAVAASRWQQVPFSASVTLVLESMWCCAVRTVILQACSGSSRTAFGCAIAESGDALLECGQTCRWCCLGRFCIPRRWGTC